jgi:uncharacterized protein YecE (DUF72 family)
LDAAVFPWRNRITSNAITSSKFSINGYGYQYSDADLQTLKNRTAEKSTYVLFNNKWMTADSLRFMKLI